MPSVAFIANSSALKLLKIKKNVWAWKIELSDVKYFKHKDYENRKKDRET